MKDTPNVSTNSSPGFVTKIRLAPKDVLACIDCMDAAGARVTGMSLSAAIKMGIAIALETLRGEKVIPTRDGFEYLDMVQQFTNTQPRIKVKVGHALVVADKTALLHDSPRPSLAQVPPSRPDPSPDEIKRARAKERIFRKIKEMQFQRDSDPSNFTRAQRAELARLEQEILK